MGRTIFRNKFGGNMNKDEILNVPVETKTLYSVWCNTDRTEGRGYEYVKYFCELKSTAIRLSKKGYVQGSDCPVKEISGYIIDGKLYLPHVMVEYPTKEDLEQEKIIAAREAAFEKAKSLGLTEEDINNILLPNL